MAPSVSTGSTRAATHPLGVLLLMGAETVPRILLGASQNAFTIYALTTAVVGFFQHTNIDVRLGPLNWIFSAVELHRWHHSTVIAEANQNYGSNLIVWDVLFGTRFLPDRRPPLVVGIGDLPNFPRDYWRQMAVPFLWRRLRAGTWPVA